MTRAISATTLCRERPEFGQRIVPARGSVLASPVMANWDPEPDYFFHWIRDTAVVMRALVDLTAMASSVAECKQWEELFHDIVKFNLALSQATPAPANYREVTQENCRQFLRNRRELDHLQGDKLLTEPRFNPDGSVDILRWSCPQLDGPALRALSCLAWLSQGGTHTPELIQLLQQDLDFTLRFAGRRSVGPWEEPGEFYYHYFVMLVQLGALVHGREFASDIASDKARADRWRRAERRLERLLDKHWLPERGVFAAMREKLDSTGQTDFTIPIADSAILLAILDADLAGHAHSVTDHRAEATLEALTEIFADAFPVNHERPRGAAPALGRSLEDRYFGGNPWYVTTLAAAVFCFRRAIAEPEAGTPWRARGDEWMATIRWMTPEDGSFSEQVDRDTLLPRSAQHLTWSYAAFISTVRLRNHPPRSAMQ